MKRIIAILLAVVSSLCMLCSCGNTDDIYVMDSSYLQNYYVVGDTVYLLCSLTIRNTTEEACSFVINVRDEESFNNGLISNPVMSAYLLDAQTVEDVDINNLGTKEQRFSIGANTRQTYIVVFEGTHGKSDKRPSLTLPEKIFIQDVMVAD